MCFLFKSDKLMEKKELVSPQKEIKAIPHKERACIAQSVFFGAHFYRRVMRRLVCAMQASMLARQIVQKFCRLTVVSQEISVQYAGIICK